MIAILIRTITDRRALAAISALVLVLAVAVQTARLQHAKSDLAQARSALTNPATGRMWKAEATACAKVETAYAGALQSQNAAISRLHEASLRATARASKAVGLASLAGAGERLAAQQVLVAKPHLDACADADALILQSLDLESRQ